MAITAVVGSLIADDSAFRAMSMMMRNAKVEVLLNGALAPECHLAQQESFMDLCRPAAA